MGLSGQEGSAWVERGGDLSAVGAPFEDTCGENKTSELLIDSLIIT